MVASFWDGLRAVDMSLRFGSKASDTLLIFSGNIEKRCIESRGYELIAYCENRRFVVMFNGNSGLGWIVSYGYKLMV